jgi:hypothetical protein
VAILVVVESGLLVKCFIALVKLVLIVVILLFLLRLIVLFFFFGLFVKPACRESIVPLSCLLRRVYIVPDFACPAGSDSDSDSVSSEEEQQHPMDAMLVHKRFHLSPFKW